MTDYSIPQKTLDPTFARLEHPLIETSRMFAGNRAALSGLVMFLIIVVVSLAGPWLYPTDPFEMVWSPFSPPGVKGFLLGTDYLGRDLLAQIIHGGRATLAVGCAAALLSVFIGITFGALSGFYPRVKAAFNVSEPEQLAWAFAKFSDNSLLAEAREFFSLMRETGLLAQLQERYYGHQNQLDNVGTLTFLRQADERLEKYQPLFEQTALQHDVDWRLLAAIGYQESHWRARARSRTGVRGLMMLTRTTAKEMGVENRLDPEQSIVGGSAYFAKLKKRFSHINEPDRTWLSLAAYNVGAGHVRDAQRLTEQQGGDSERWMDVKDRLPLLTKKKYYKNTQYGYARGYEPVHYVQNIRKFYDLLVWREQPEPSYTMLGEGSIFTASNTYKTIPPLTQVN